MSVSSAILDGPYSSKHVCSTPWYVGFFYLILPLSHERDALVNIALCKLWKRAKNATKPTPAAIDIAIALMVFSGVVFRAEVAILLASTVAQILLSGWAPLKRVIKVGLISAAVSIGMSSNLNFPRHRMSDFHSSNVVLTVIVDSYFWQQWPLWPELYGLYFNVIQGKSSEWGVSFSSSPCSAFVDVPHRSRPSTPISRLTCPNSFSHPYLSS